MKTYKQFVAEAVPLIAAPLAPLVVGAGVKALDYVLKARKQGEGKRSQPVDYGQGGTATPRGKSVQRGRLNSNDAYNRAKKEERKKEAQRRARERAEQGIDELIGSEEDRRYAKQKRQERGLDNLVGKAARELGIKLPEGYKGQRKEDALNARYKDLQNPKDPREQMVRDALKGIRLKGV